MKKSLICALIIACVLLCGCNRDGYLLFVHNTPEDYKDSKWVSNDPDMWFTIEFIIDEEAAANQYLYSPETNHVGEIKYDGRVYTIFMEFNIDLFSVYSTVDGEKIRLFAGMVQCNSEKCTLSINEKMGDNIFNGAYDEITLYRTE